jgi:predicted lipoprotein with Yx(FWY)xxD motif
MRQAKKATLLVAAIALAVGGLVLATSSGAATRKDVKTGTTSLGTVLVNSKGFTLYRLSGEKKGHFKGHPLYRFTQDTQEGDTKGQGFKDVGTWGVIKVKKPSSGTQQNQTSTQNTGGYGY